MLKQYIRTNKSRKGDDSQSVLTVLLSIDRELFESFTAFAKPCTLLCSKHLLKQVFSSFEILFVLLLLTLLDTQNYCLNLVAL